MEFSGDLPRKPNDFLPNETCSYNHIYQSEIQKEQSVPLVLMDGHRPQMSSLLKSHKPDNGNFSVIEAQSHMKCPHGEVCASVPTNGGINSLGKVLSKFSGKLVLLRGNKKDFAVLKIKFEDAFRKVVVQAN